MKPSFNKTVDILVKAYLNDTLEHGNCTACAVGNLIAHAKGITPVLMQHQSGDVMRFSDGTIPQWLNVFCSVSVGFQKQNPSAYYDGAKHQIDSTGYTWQELAQIEFAFEKDSNRFIVAFGSSERKDAQMFQGLMNVVEVLADIHGISLEQKESAKLQFVKS